jgi:hypothetical protein
MQGPDDATIEAQLAGVELTERESEDEPPPPPPGGKPLLRLLSQLGPAGYDEAARATIELAVNPAQEEMFLERTTEMLVLPEVGKRKTGAGGKSRSQRATAPPAAETVAAEDVAQEFLAAVDSLGPPTPTGPQWRPLGPWTIPNGQTYGASRVNVSGRIAAIAVDPSNPAHVLAGAANGGVWESANRGASWAPRTDYQAHAGGGCTCV